MELKRIIARDSRTATEKAMALYGPDVLVIANQSIDGQTELIVAIDIAPEAPAALVREEPQSAFQAMEPARVHKPASGNMAAFEEAMAMVRNTVAAGAEAPHLSQPVAAVAPSPTPAMPTPATPEHRAPVAKRRPTARATAHPATAAPEASAVAPRSRQRRGATTSAAVMWGDLEIPTLNNLGASAPVDTPAPARRRPRASAADATTITPVCAQEEVTHTLSPTGDLDWQVPGVGDITVSPRSTARRRSAKVAADVATPTPPQAVEADTVADTNSVAKPARRRRAPTIASVPSAPSVTTAVSETVSHSPVVRADVPTPVDTTADLSTADDSARGRELVDLVRAEIASLRQEFVTTLKLQQLHSGTADHPVATPLMQALEQAGAPAALRTLLLDDLVQATDMADGQRRLQQALQAGLQAQAQAMPMSGVHALCGPSGAGKSLMAARWLGQASRSVAPDQMALISYCDPRPGAWSQTQMLAAASGVPAYRAANPDTLKVLLNELHDRVLVVIDTPGTEPLRHAQTLREHTPEVELHTVLPADASAATVRRFLLDAGHRWCGLWVSKLDESEQPWALLQALCNQRMPIMGLSDSASASAPVLRWRPESLLDRALAPLGAWAAPPETDSHALAPPLAHAPWHEPPPTQLHRDVGREPHTALALSPLGVGGRAGAPIRPATGVLLNALGVGRSRPAMQHTAAPRQRPRPQRAAA